MSKEILLPGTGGEYVPLFPLLANYWDKPLSELPEELRARVSLQKKKRLVGHQPKFDASGEFERDAEGHYPVWEEVYAEHHAGDFILDWDALTPAPRQELVRQIDARHTPKSKAEAEEEQYYFNLACKKYAIEKEIRECELMHHQNIPSEAKIQRERLSELRAELEDIKKRFKLPPPDAPAATGESSDAAGKGEAGTALTTNDNESDDAEIHHRGLDGAPPLKKGKNSCVKVAVWVKWQANKMVKQNDTLPDLIGRIRLEANKWGYESERKPLTNEIIRKMLPPKITGGREKIRGKSKK